eukprot:SAG11_NODE_175_length_13457_cov_42.095673_12_plen_415_part_00
MTSSRASASSTTEEDISAVAEFLADLTADSSDEELRVSSRPAVASARHAQPEAAPDPESARPRHACVDAMAYAVTAPDAVEQLAAELTRDAQPSEANLRAALSVCRAERWAVRVPLGSPQLNSVLVQRLLRLAARDMPPPLPQLCAEMADALLKGPNDVADGAVGTSPFDCTYGAELDDEVMPVSIGEGALALKVKLQLPAPRSLARYGGDVAVPRLFFPSAHILARLLLQPRTAARLRGLRVIEVGAGCHGLPSMAAAVAGAHEVVATEIDAYALELLRAQLARPRSGGGCAIQMARLDWGECAALSQPPKELGDHFDVVIGSDVIHELGMGQRLLHAVRALLGCSGGLAMLLNPAAAHRFGVDEFEAILQSGGWDYEVEDVVNLGAELVANVDTQGLSYQIWYVRLPCGVSK